MAHIKSIVVGKGSYGSIGDVTVRTVGGSVIASQKISRKGGLSTFKQVLQQVRIANIMRGYTELNLSAPNGKGMYMAFPDRPEGLSNVNMFVRYNFAKAEVAALTQTKEEAAADLLVPAPFVVTRGTLPSIGSLFTLVQETETTAAYIVTPVTSITPGPQTTMGSFYEALSEALEALGAEIRQGDTLTFFVMSYKPTGAPATKIFAPQLVVDLASEETLPSYMERLSDGHLAFDLGELLGVSGFDFDFAPVLGRNSVNGYQVSNSEFTDNMLTSDAYLDHYGSEKEMLAALSYGYRDDPFLQQGFSF